MSDYPIKWNIHPGKGTWLVVYVWGSLEEMYEFVESKHPDWGNDYHACWLGEDWVFDKKGELKTRKLGELHFVNGLYGVGVAAHEIQHFISSWTDAMGWDVGEKQDEDVSLMVGKLTKEFWNGHYANFDK